MSVSVSGASGFLEAAVAIRSPVERVCLLDPRVAFGCKPDILEPLLLTLVGTAHFGLWVTEVSPWGAGSIIPRSGETLRDDTSMSSALLGDEACGGVSLSIISGKRSPEEEDC